MSEASYSHILNWKLLSGSHEFPGPEGGTCINEAAIVAAGFEYRKVNGALDLPKCFCPIIGEYAIWLNDSIKDDALRNQALLRFVTRLSGTKDSMGIEQARLQAAFDVFASVWPREADVFIRTPRSRSRYYTLAAMAPKLDYAGMQDAYCQQGPPQDLYELVTFIRTTAGGSIKPDGPYTSKAYYTMGPGLVAVCTTALEAMLSIGNKAKPVEVAEVTTRMEAIKAKARETVDAR